MAACSDVDGDVLGELLPRHPPLAARPGLGWVVAGGRRALVQVGRDGGRAVGLGPRSVAGRWPGSVGGDGARPAVRSISRGLRKASRHDSLRPVRSTERS